MQPFYPLATGAMKTLLVSLTRWKVMGKENVPPNGSLIVVCNHLSLIDPPLLSACIPRRIVFMAKEELFRSRGGVFVRAFGAFPVHRGVGKEALRQAEAVLKGGQVLGMFPEGKRSADHALGKAEVGAALVALRSGVPILPVGITGSENIKGPGFWLQRPRIVVRIGKPFRLGECGDHFNRDRLAQSSDIIMRHIAAVLPPPYQGLYTETAESGDDRTGVVNGD